MENSWNHDVPSWTRMMTQCQMERDAFKKQVKKLTERLQGAEIYCGRQDAKVKQLTTEKEKRMIQTEALQGEVERLKDHIGTSSRQQEERGIMQNQMRLLSELLGRASAINISEHELRLKIWEELERTKEQLARQEIIKKVPKQRKGHTPKTEEAAEAQWRKDHRQLEGYHQCPSFCQKEGNVGCPKRF
ncbi:hypothetical protein KUCAC02_028708 [Chaenocephalus aceratus]|uniref:Uncharacterized protein n=1 Tax=Chaenocephalus aceratus TaxID=36190 RepID=A0ACB9X382_CHAAC|nr:hypothetical protein KUCAC02_028708 [Chaenocephalus aceratus]